MWANRDTLKQTPSHPATQPPSHPRTHRPTNPQTNTHARIQGERPPPPQSGGHEQSPRQDHENWSNQLTLWLSKGAVPGAKLRKQEMDASADKMPGQGSCFFARRRCLQSSIFLKRFMVLRCHILSFALARKQARVVSANCAKST